MMTHMGQASGRFRRQHRDLLELAEQLEALSDPTGFDVAALSRLFARLAGKLKVHVAMEDETLYFQLLDVADPDVQEVALDFKERFMPLGGDFVAFQDRWDSESMAKSPADFDRELRAFFVALRARIEEEESVLFEHYDRLFPEAG